VLETIGAIIAISGSLVSIYGNLQNTIYQNHFGALKTWTYSSILLMVWAAGNSIQLWHGGISSGIMAVMYAIFTATNIRGWIKYDKHGHRRERKDQDL